MSKFNSLTLGVLMLTLALLCIGCGEEEVSFRDPNDLPPINAGALDDVRSEDQIVEDAERAEGAKTAPAGRAKRR